MHSRLVELVVAGALLLGGVLAVNHIVDKLNADWQARVDSVQTFADGETARAEVLHSEASYLQAQADSLAALAPVVDTMRIVEIMEVAVPDTCEVFVAPRDSVISELLQNNGLLREALATERTAAERLRAAYVSLEVAYDSVSAVLDDRPIQLPRFIPRVSMGAFAGICTDGQPCAGIGIGLTWKVRLPL